MWISKKKLKANHDQSWVEGMEVGYRLGFQMGLTQAQTKLNKWLSAMPWGDAFKDKPRWEREIEDILKEERHES